MAIIFAEAVKDKINAEEFRHQNIRRKTKDTRQKIRDRRH